MLAASFLLLLAAAIAGAFVLNRAYDEARALRAAQLARADLFNLQLDEETGVRGYMNVRDPIFLAPYRDAMAQFPGAVAGLKDAVQDAHIPSGAARVEQLRAINDTWQRTIAAPRILSGHSSYALALTGKALLDRYRAVDATLRADIARYADAADRNGAATLQQIAIALLVAVAAIGVWIVSISRSQLRMRNVLEREQARQNELERAIRELRSIAASIPEIVFIADPQGNATYFNTRWFDTTGFAPQESLGTAWVNGVHPEDRESLRDRWAAATSSGAPFEHEFRIRTTGGEYRWHVSRAIAQRGPDDRIVSWFGTTRNIHMQHEQLEATQRVADALQRALLPETLPKHAAIHFDATYSPASDVAKVGGDWYDAIALHDGRFLFSIGDVAGHGLQSAVVMSRVRQAILALATEERDPASLLRRANRALRLQVAETMVTAICGFFDPRTLAMTYATAGHPPPILYTRQNGATLLARRGMALGIEDDITLPTFMQRVAPGSMLVLYTDGLVEFDRDVESAELRLLDVVGDVGRQNLPHPAAEIHARTLDGANAHDDIALLTARLAS